MQFIFSAPRIAEVSLAGCHNGFDLGFERRDDGFQLVIVLGQRLLLGNLLKIENLVSEIGSGDLRLTLEKTGDLGFRQGESGRV